MKIYYFLYVFLCCQIFFSHAQQIQFNNYYNFGSQYFNCRDMVATADSGFMLTGYSGSSAFGGYYILKINQQGIAEWVDNGTNNPFLIWGRAIKKTSNDNYLMAGEYDNKLLIKKVSINGDSLFEKHFTLSGGDYHVQSMMNFNNELFITGFLRDSLQTQFNYLLKINEEGDSLGIIYHPTFNYPDVSQSLVKTGENSYASIGSVYDSLSGRFESALLKSDTLGNQIFLKVDTSSSYTSLTLASDSGFLISGFSSMNRIRLVKTDTAGIIKWEKYFYGGLYSSVVSTVDNGCILTFLGSMLRIMRIDSTGNNILWEDSIPYLQTDYMITSLTNSFDGSYATGGRFSNGSITTSFTYLIKFADTYLSGIEEMYSENTFQIFPNPTTKAFTIKNISANERTSLQIFNPFGEIVYTENLFGKNEYGIDANFTKGVYFVRVKDVVRKLVVE